MLHPIEKIKNIYNVQIVVLLQEIANFIIETTKAYLDPENILKSEIDDAYEQIHLAVKVIRDFKRLFYEYREKEFFRHCFSYL